MRKLRKPLSWLLAVCMLFSLLPGTALAADPDPAPVADTTTYTDWEDLFGVGGSAYLTTKDIGRIWTDKSVSTQDITLPGTNIDGLENNTVKKEADADFLVALSGRPPLWTRPPSPRTPSWCWTCRPRCSRMSMRWSRRPTPPCGTC